MNHASSRLALAVSLFVPGCGMEGLGGVGGESSDDAGAASLSDAGFGGGAGGSASGGASSLDSGIASGGSSGGGSSPAGGDGGGDGGAAAGGSSGGSGGEGGGAGGAGGGGPFADAGVGPDAGLPHLTSEEACALQAEWGLGGGDFDLDGDCFVRACDAFAADSRCVLLTDCDDERPDVNPAMAERCNGRDDDCDGNRDDGFDVGGECETLCGLGKLECSVTTPDALACSTSAGQSQAPAPESVREICDTVDNDCDGEVDDDCRLPLDEVNQRSQPVICPDGRLILIENDSLVERGPEGDTRTLAVGGATLPFAPSCGASGLAWLELTGACETPADGPERCRGRIRSLPADAALDAPSVELSSPGLLGRPVVAGDEVLWHSVIGPELTLFARDLRGLGDTRTVGLNESDPAVGPVAGDATDYVAVRRWSDGASQVLLQSLRNQGQSIFVTNPVGAPGPPALNERWVVWGIPGALWGVPRMGELVGDGLQLAEHGAPTPDPHLSALKLVYLDASDDQTILQVLDLETGLVSPVVAAEIRTGDFDVWEGVVHSVRQEAPGPGLYRTALP